MGRSLDRKEIGRPQESEICVFMPLAHSWKDSEAGSVLLK